jgi:hypothetical protein
MPAASDSCLHLATLGAVTTDSYLVPVIVACLPDGVLMTPLVITLCSHLL